MDTTIEPCESEWRAESGMLGTTIYDSHSGHAMACIGLTIDGVNPHPSGSIWGGHIAEYVCLICLEGGTEP